MTAVVNIIKDIFNKTMKSDFCQRFADCISYASQRTREYLVFKDPENKFCVSSSLLKEIFLMTYISRSVQLQLPEMVNCTIMTQKQEILMGTDWVWAVLDDSSKDPKVQIAVHVFHMAGEENVPSDQVVPMTEAVQMAKLEASDKTKQEKIITFCSSIGKDCYTLFMFFGTNSDPVNIYGVLSNNFHVAFGKGVDINKAFIENFLKRSEPYNSPAKMLQTILHKGSRQEETVTMVVKFT
uniref:Sb:cb470 n=1 Tax=Erpetoichthys calabaricus TaxID=27687 RepID=A0A8C4RUM0_ERPCA